MKENQSVTLQTGTVIYDRYRILECLGIGSVAMVYKCQDQFLPGHVVALKVLFPRLSSDPNLVARFCQEIAASYIVNHRNVVRTFDYIHDGNLVALTMEFVPGGSLADLINGNLSMSIEDIVAKLSQMCCGVQAIHEVGIVHRDLKPENILISTDGTPKIADFSIAWTGAAAKLTKHGSVLGTVAYVSPEYLEFGHLDERSDLYALGIIAYEMIIGESIYKGTSLVENITKRVHSDPPAPHLVRHDCPEELSRIILKAMTRDRDRRYQTALEMYEDLRAFMPHAVPYDSSTSMAIIRAARNSIEEHEDDKTKPTNRCLRLVKKGALDHAQALPDHVNGQEQDKTPASEYGADEVEVPDKTAAEQAQGEHSGTDSQIDKKNSRASGEHRRKGQRSRFGTIVDKHNPESGDLWLTRDTTTVNLCSEHNESESNARCAQPQTLPQQLRQAAVGGGIFVSCLLALGLFAIGNFNLDDFKYAHANYRLSSADTSMIDSSSVALAPQGQPKSPDEQISTEQSRQTNASVVSEKRRENEEQTQVTHNVPIEAAAVNPLPSAGELTAGASVPTVQIVVSAPTALKSDLKAQEQSEVKIPAPEHREAAAEKLAKEKVETVPAKASTAERDLPKKAHIIQTPQPVLPLPAVAKQPAPQEQQILADNSATERARLNSEPKNDMAVDNAPYADDLAFEYKVKGSLLYRFAEFVEWPASKLAQREKQFSICLIGSNPFGSYADKMIAGKVTSRGEKVVVYRLTVFANPENLKTCHVAFLTGNTRPQLDNLLPVLRSSGVLTVTDQNGGGVINFSVSSGRVRFAIDKAEAEKHGLTINSRLYQLMQAN